VLKDITLEKPQSAPTLKMNTEIRAACWGITEHSTKNPRLLALPTRRHVPQGSLVWRDKEIPHGHLSLSRSQSAVRYDLPSWLGMQLASHSGLDDSRTDTAVLTDWALSEMGVPFSFAGHKSLPPKSSGDQSPFLRRSSRSSSRFSPSSIT
jgi:hypothetical protein